MYQTLVWVVETGGQAEGLVRRTSTEEKSLRRLTVIGPHRVMLIYVGPLLGPSREPVVLAGPRRKLAVNVDLHQRTDWR